MKRREFIKFLGAGIGAAVVAPKVALDSIVNATEATVPVPTGVWVEPVELIAPEYWSQRLLSEFYERNVWAERKEMKWADAYDLYCGDTVKIGRRE